MSVCLSVPGVPLCLSVFFSVRSLTSPSGLFSEQPIPECTSPPEGFVVHAELELDVPVEHGLLLENLLDLAHAPFTHTSTFAKVVSVCLLLDLAHAPFTHTSTWSSCLNDAHRCILS
jgi:Vanillate O-demethylase oxygenase C-terminal domain